MASVVVSILHYKFNPTCLSGSGPNYILSSITQGLASLFALLFVIVFFICQSTGRFSTLPHIIKEPLVQILLYLFVFTIILPLVIIKIGSTHMLINFAIFFASLCLSYVIALIFYAKEKVIDFGFSNILNKLGSLKFPEDNNKLYNFTEEIKDIGVKYLVKNHQEKVITLLNRIRPQLLNISPNTDISDLINLTVDINIFTSSCNNKNIPVFEGSSRTIISFLMFIGIPTSTYPQCSSITTSLKKCLENLTKCKSKEQYELKYYELFIRRLLLAYKSIRFPVGQKKDAWTTIKKEHIEEYLVSLFHEKIIDKETYIKNLPLASKTILKKEKREKFEKFMMNLIPSDETRE